MKIPGQRPLSVAQQYLYLRTNPICAGTGAIGRGRLSWEYDAQPTPLSRSYNIRITYQMDQRPKILIRNPDLIELAGKRRLPHVYQQDPPLLCLYRPMRQEWTPFMRLDQTIVPWASLWLFFFEEWLVSDEWKGGGEHPEKFNDEQSAKRKRH